MANDSVYYREDCLMYAYCMECIKDGRAPVLTEFNEVIIVEDVVPQGTTYACSICGDHVWFTKYKDDHKKRPNLTRKCMDCSAILETMEDYYGGGSHYWCHICPMCHERYTYDTYGFTLRRWPWKEEP